MKDLKIIILLFAFIIACNKSPSEPEHHYSPQLPSETVIPLDYPEYPPYIVGMHFNEGYGHSFYTTFRYFRIVKDIQPIDQYPNWIWNTDYIHFIEIFITATVLDDKNVSWSIKHSHNEEQTELSMVSEGITNLDGKSGTSWELYDFYTTNLRATGNWLQNDSLLVNVRNLENKRHYEIIAKQDGSRILNTSSENETQIFYAQWNVNSKRGSWTSYDENTGNILDNGSW